MRAAASTCVRLFSAISSPIRRTSLALRACNLGVLEAEIGEDVAAALRDPCHSCLLAALRRCFVGQLEHDRMAEIPYAQGTRLGISNAGALARSRTRVLAVLRNVTVIGGVGAKAGLAGSILKMVGDGNS